MRTLTFLTLLLGFTACLSPAERIQRANAQYEKIGQDWASKHPCETVDVKPDTVELVDYDTSNTAVFRDLWARSVAEGKFKTDSAAEAMAIFYNEVIDSLLKHPNKTTQRIIRDTVQDHRTEEILRTQGYQKDQTIAHQAGQLDQVGKQVVQERRRGNNWEVAFFGLVALVVICLVVYIILKIRGSLPLKTT